MFVLYTRELLGDGGRRGQQNLWKYLRDVKQKHFTVWLYLSSKKNPPVTSFKSHSEVNVKYYTNFDIQQLYQ